MSLLLFFDSCALVKRYVTEPGSGWVGGLTRANSGHTLNISRITSVEITAAITRRQRGGGLSAARANSSFRQFRRHLADRYVLPDVRPSLLTEAMGLARKHGLRGYDAVQLASLFAGRRSLESGGLGLLSLASSDHELNRGAVDEGVAVIDPTTHR
jgi:predicted nucleic acid-binding protein